MVRQAEFSRRDEDQKFCVLIRILSAPEYVSRDREISEARQAGDRPGFFHIADGPPIMVGSSCLTRTVCVSVRFEMMGMPLTLEPERERISNSSSRVTSLLECSVGVAFIFTPRSTYSEAG